MTAKIKLNAASGGGSFSLQAPSSSANNRVFTLPDVADAAMATVNGITEYDAWVITSDFTTDASSPDYFNSNWARQDLGNSLFEKIGTGMTESSGIFTFPSTGKYQINAEWSINANGVTDSNVLGSMYATHNNSSYTMIARASVSIAGSNVYNVSAQSMVDVTDTSNLKIRLASDSSTGVIFEGQNGAMRTGIIFKRLGDT